MVMMCPVCCINLHDKDRGQMRESETMGYPRQRASFRPFGKRACWTRTLTGVDGLLHTELIDL